MTASTAGKRCRPLHTAADSYNCVADREPTTDLMNLDDTIVAIATPPGRGGIGVVRLAGPQARTIAEPMLRLKHPLAAGQAIFGELIEPCGTSETLNGDGAGSTGRTEPSLSLPKGV